MTCERKKKVPTELFSVNTIAVKDLKFHSIFKKLVHQQGNKTGYSNSTSSVVFWKKKKHNLFKTFKFSIEVS